MKIKIKVADIKKLKTLKEKILNQSVLISKNLLTIKYIEWKIKIIFHAITWYTNNILPMISSQNQNKKMIKLSRI